MASFPAKIGWKRLRMTENKNYRSDPFLRRVIENSKKIKKKIQKIKKHHFGFFSRKNWLEMAVNERK